MIIQANSMLKKPGREEEASQDPRDYFDMRPDILRTFTEAALVVNSIELHRGERPHRRDNFYLVYSAYPERQMPGGVIEWTLEPRGNGISNYNEQARLSFIEDGQVKKFIEEVLAQPTTIGVMAMDRKTALLLHEIPGLSNPYKVQFIGMKRDYVSKE